MLFLASLGCTNGHRRPEACQTSNKVGQGLASLPNRSWTASPQEGPETVHCGRLPQGRQTVQGAVHRVLDHQVLLKMGKKSESILLGFFNRC